MELLAKPVYSWEEGEDGFLCTCTVLGVPTEGKVMPNKTKAKQSAAEAAYAHWSSSPAHRPAPYLTQYSSDYQFTYPQSK